MLATILLVGIMWGIYGLITGVFIGTRSCLTWLGYAMAVIYVFISCKALLSLDWTLIIGVPCFLSGTTAGRKIAGRSGT